MNNAWSAKKDALMAALDDGGFVPPEFFNHNLPPGYSFSPEDEELIGYLRKKVSGNQLPANQIFEVDLYLHNPQELTGAYKVREKEWYFFTPRDRKYPGGSRPSRAAKDGYWKPTGTGTPIMENGHTVGFKKALDFYQGKHPLGKKTEWKMHEYTLNIKRVPATKVKGAYSSMKLDDWVLCKLYKNLRGQRGVKHAQVQEIPNEILGADLHIPDSPLESNQQGSQEVPVEQNFDQAMPMSDPALQSKNDSAPENESDTSTPSEKSSIRSNSTTSIDGACTRPMLDYSRQDVVPYHDDDLESLLGVSNAPTFDMGLRPVDQETNLMNQPFSGSTFPEDNFIDLFCEFDEWSNYQSYSNFHYPNM